MWGVDVHLWPHHLVEEWPENLEYVVSTTSSPSCFIAVKDIFFILIFQVLDLLAMISLNWKCSWTTLETCLFPGDLERGRHLVFSSTSRGPGVLDLQLDLASTKSLTQFFPEGYGIVATSRSHWMIPFWGICAVDDGNQSVSDSGEELKDGSSLICFSICVCVCCARREKSSTIWWGCLKVRDGPAI